MKKFLLVCVAVFAVVMPAHGLTGLFRPPSTNIQSAFSAQFLNVSQWQQGNLTGYNSNGVVISGKINSSGVKFVMSPTDKRETITIETTGGNGIRFEASKMIIYANQTISISTTGSAISRIMFRGANGPYVSGDTDAGSFQWDDSDAKYPDYIYTLSKSTTRVEFKTMYDLELTLSIQFELVEPLAAPTVDMGYRDDLVVAGYPKLVEEDGIQEFQYLFEEGQLLRLAVPDGASKVRYTIDGRTDPKTEGILEDIVGGICPITLPKVGVGYTTEVRAVCLDASGNPGDEFRIVCRRMDIATPSAPRVLQYYTDALIVKDSSYQYYYSYDKSTVRDVDDNNTIYLTHNYGLIKLSDTYGDHVSLKFRYAIDDSPVANGSTAYSADAFVGLEPDALALYLPSRTYNNSTQSWDEAPSQGSDIFTGSNPDVSYLHIINVTANPGSIAYRESEPVTYTLRRLRPQVEELELDVVNGTYQNRTARFSQYMQIKDVAAANMDVAQYYFAFSTTDEVTTIDPANPSTLRLTKDLETGKWYSEKKFTESGYLSVFAVNSDNILGPAFTIRLEKLPTVTLDNLGALNASSADAAIFNNRLVIFNCPLLVEGVENTVDNAKFMYVRDPEGNAIKFVNNGSNIFFHDVEGEHYAVGQEIPAGGITGMYRYNDGWPQIDVYVGPGDDYRPYSVAGIVPVSDWADYNPARRDIDKSDFNRHVVLSGMQWTDNESTFLTEDGTEVVGYGRFTEHDTPLKGLKAGQKYRVEGFVGQREGELRIFPTSVTSEIVVLAPNPIIADPDAEGWTTVNVISDEVKLTIDRTGVEGRQFVYRFADTEAYLNWPENSQRALTITADNYGADGVCHLQVAYMENGEATTPLKIRFVKHAVTGTFDNIADFKALYPDEVETPDPRGGEVKYYRYTGKAQVRAITPRYLYLRDYENCPAGEESKHSLLLYNENGWNAAVEMKGGDGSRARALTEGDIITDFVLIADRIPQMHGLRGYATGFARTLHRVEVDPAEVSSPKNIDATKDDFGGFDDSDRMVRYWIENVTVTHREDGVYVLDIPGAPELNINDVFQYTGGWATSYRAGTVYDIEGVVLLNGKPVDGQTKHYAVAMTNFKIGGAVPALSLPSLEGVADSDASAPLTFMTTAKVVLAPAPGSITEDGGEKLMIYYTIDGSDPRNNPQGRKVYTEPFEISSSVTVKAYAAIAGHMPSAVVERTFTRLANDRRYIVNFINQAEPNVAYHFTGDARVVKKGGEYIFIRGAVGHYLPIHVTEDAIDMDAVPEGAYLADFVAEADFVNNRVRGARITPAYSGMFGGILDPAPSNLDIRLEPDEVTTITAENARRYVRISGVKLIGTEFETEDGISQQDTEWKLITNRGEESGVEIRVNHNILEPEFDWDNTDTDEAAYYNITGFAMLGDDGTIELWPTEVEKVRAAKLVVPTFSGGIISQTQMLELTTVKFYPSTTVTLTCPIIDPESATIEYIITPDENAPADDAKWNVYAQPFAVISDAYIHMRATAPGYETSTHSHLKMILAADDDPEVNVSGRVVFSLDNTEAGSVKVKIEPEVTPSGDWSIYYTTDPDKALTPSNGTLYTGPFELTESGLVIAILVEGGKPSANVCEVYVWVAPTAVDSIGSDKIEEIRADGDRIIAPEGSEVYDLNGRRVRAEGLRPGIYIVRTPSCRTVKVKL